MVFYLICKTWIIYSSPILLKHLRAVGGTRLVSFPWLPSRCCSLPCEQNSRPAVDTGGTWRLRVHPTAVLARCSIFICKNFQNSYNVHEIKCPNATTISKQNHSQFWFYNKSSYIYIYVKLFPPLWPPTHNGHR